MENGRPALSAIASTTRIVNGQETYTSYLAYVLTCTSSKIFLQNYSKFQLHSWDRLAFESLCA